MASLSFTPQGFRSVLPAPLPDLIVQSVTVTPASPNTGDHVVFSAVVKNQGAGPTRTGDSPGLLFSIDGNPVNWTTDLGGVQAANGTRTLTASAGTSGGNYWVATQGTHQLDAQINDTLSVSETDVGNNTLSTSVTVTTAASNNTTGYGPSATTWLRHGSPSDWQTPYATVSSVSAALSAAASAPDGATIVLTAGSYGPIAIPAGNSRTVPVVICGAPHQPVTFSTVDFNGSDIALARFTHTSSLHFNPGSSGAECAVFRTMPAGCYVKSAQNIRIAGQIFDQTYVTNGDRWHVNSDDITAPGGMDITEFYWGVLERVSGGTGHVDQIQMDAGTDIATTDGTFMVRLGNGFIDAAVASGVNGFQFKADQQPAGYTYGRVVFDTLWSVDAGGGQGDASNQSGPTTITNSVFESWFRFNDASLVTATGNTFAGNSPDSRWPNNTWGSLGGKSRPSFDIPGLLQTLGLS